MCPAARPGPKVCLYGILKLHELILKDPFLTQQYKEQPAGPAGGGGMKQAVALLEEKFADEVVEVVEFRGDTTVDVKPEQIVEICTALKDGHDTGFKYLSMIAGHGLLPRKPPVRRGL